MRLEFKLAGIFPEPWTVSDSLSILYYMAWSTSANLNHEIVGRMLLQAVGANIPGLPGMAIGRTQHVSIAMTNNYGDMRDL